MSIMILRRLNKQMSPLLRKPRLLALVILLAISVVIAYSNSHRRITILSSIPKSSSIQTSERSGSEADPNPTVTNRNKDLSGLNNGDFNALWWEKDERASEYAFFRGPTSDGPWEEVAKVSLPSGVDFTSEARLRQLCYRVEALDANGGVILRYDPVCLTCYL